ncbi:aspartate/glutamate racemase family protein [Butyrivibrio sp. M55]|uniref:aspartate/glutamate racemase family protein n=1 Tax=Butyrivibrio sp. M55 TaxID=1855323 RepID=UPI0008E6AE79|nr:amino acid racemase [Butyrivibrio sp. M55]SFU54256.1 aspartate racemase [Butyrivibrio sp. M55]
MKKVGIIGGMGPESTIPYYHDIVYGVQKAVGQDMFPSLSIESVDVYKVLKLCENQDYQLLIEYLSGAIQNLCNCGCDFIVMAANTPHIVFDELQEKINVKMISIVEATAEKAEQIEMRKLGLIGTMTTMKADYYRTPFENRGISIVTPCVSDMEYISEKISSELERGIIKESTRAQIYGIIEKIGREQGVDGIILGCTELPLIIEEATCPLKCLDTMKIHIEAIVNMIVEK